MQKVQIFINQEKDQAKQIEYIRKVATVENRLLTVGRIVKTYSNNTRTKLTGVYILDIETGTLINVDRQVLVTLLEDDSISDKLDIVYKGDKIQGKYADIKSYPSYLDLYTLYKEEDRAKGVLVAIRKDTNDKPAYSVMDTCSIIAIGDIEYATLTIYTKDELIDAVKSNRLQLINGVIQDEQIQSSIF